MYSAQTFSHSRGIASHATRARQLLALALGAALLATACEAQKPTAKSAASSDAAAKAAAQGQRYSEPGLKGRIVDAETKQPIAGAIIYGYYATSEGTLAGGRKFVQGVKSFAATTDAQGVFMLEAWDTGDRLIKGEVRGDFPMISIYKPGYVLEHRNLASIRKWRPLSAGRHPETGALDTLARLEEMDPKHPTSLPKPIVTDNLIDWTRDALPLYRVLTERERFETLDNSSVGVMYMGDCGWEVYAPLLMAQHVEVINAKRRLIPADRRKADDMPKDSYPLGVKNRTPDAVDLEKMLIRQAPLHRLRDSFNAASSTWICRKPEDFLRLVEAQLIGK